MLFHTPGRLPVSNRVLLPSMKMKIYEEDIIFARLCKTAFKIFIERENLSPESCLIKCSCLILFLWKIMYFGNASSPLYAILTFGV